MEGDPEYGSPFFLTYCISICINFGTSFVIKNPFFFRIICKKALFYNQEVYTFAVLFEKMPM